MDVSQRLRRQWLGVVSSVEAVVQQEAGGGPWKLGGSALKLFSPFELMWGLS